MKRVTNTWKEPIVLPLAVAGKPKERTVTQILVGESINVREDQVSPEMRAMERKSKVSIVDVVVEMEKPKPAATTQKTKPAVRKRTKKEPLSEPSLSEDEVKKLETELLQSEPDPTEG